MEYPECGTLIFDVFTTEQRIKDLYKMNLVTGLAKNRLKILKEMMEDRKKFDDLEPVSQDFILEELKEIYDKMIIVSWCAIWGFRMEKQKRCLLFEDDFDLNIEGIDFGKLSICGSCIDKIRYGKEFDYNDDMDD